LTDDGIRQYTWNAADRLVKVTHDSGAEVRNVFDGDGARRVRRELSPSGNESTTIFLDDWSEVQDGRLVRYLVHNGQRIVRLADDNGAPSQSGLAGGVESSKARWAPNGHNEVFRMLTATTLLTIVLLLTLLARGWRRRP